MFKLLIALSIISQGCSANPGVDWFCTPDLIIRSDIIMDGNSFIEKEKNLNINAEFCFNQSFGIEANWDSEYDGKKYFYSRSNSLSLTLRYYLYTYDYTGIHFGPHYRKTESESQRYSVRSSNNSACIGLSAGYQSVLFKHFLVDPVLSIDRETKSDYLNIQVKVLVGWILK